MVRAIDEQIETPAERLRRQISRAEGLVVNLKGAGQGALDMLELLDAFPARLDALRQAGMDLRSEEARIEALHAALRRKKKDLLRELEGLGGLERVRSERAPSPEGWWWFLDRALHEERRRAIRRYGRAALVIILIGSALAFIAWRLLRPDPNIIAVFDNANTAMTLSAQGDYLGAIPYLEKNVALAPQEAEWPIRLGVLQSLAGQEEAAEAAFGRGRGLSSSDVDFLLLRGQALSEANAYDRALVDLQRATTLNPQSALAQYLLAGAYAGLGRRGEAMAAYDRAAALAGEGEEQIFVMARLEAARLSQAIDLPMTGTPGP